MWGAFLTIYTAKIDSDVMNHDWKKKTDLCFKV